MQQAITCSGTPIDNTLWISHYNQVSVELFLVKYKKITLLSDKWNTQSKTRALPRHRPVCFMSLDSFLISADTILFAA